MNNDIRVEWVKSVNDVPASLWDECFPSEAEGRWWYAALENSALEDQFTFSYGVLYKDGRPAGIAPSFLMDVPIDLVMPAFIAWIMRTLGRVYRPLRYQRTLFVGSPCSDEGTVWLAPGVFAEEAFPVLHESLTERMRETKASIIVWKDFPDSYAPCFDALCRSRGLFRMVSFPGTSTKVVPGGGFDAYLKSLTSDKRNQIKRKLRKGRECGECDTEVIQRPDDAVLKEIFALFWQTYLKGRTKFEKLNYSFFQNISACDSSYYILLRRKDTRELAAFMLCFKVGGLVINKFIGIDYTLQGNWYLYFRLNEQAIEWASRSGAEVFQSGQTGYRAKTDLGSRLVPLSNYCRHRSGLVNSLFASVAKRVRMADLDRDLKEYLRAHSEI